jgi:hypothetical protein
VRLAAYVAQSALSGLDTYTHVKPGMQAEAVEKVDSRLRAALGGWPEVSRPS